MTTGGSATSSEGSKTAYVSRLSEGRQRFLAHAIEHAIECGRRTPEDFIRHFPPSTIMKGLEHHPDLRANILVLTTGVKPKIALKKAWEDAARDLQIALEEKETDAQSIVTLFQPDDRVRYLEATKLWNFLTEGDFWKASTANKSAVEIHRAHVAFMLERALEDKLITHRDVIEGITVDELASRLPKAELGRLIQCALSNADKGSSFTEVDLLATTPARTIVQYVPLTHLWDNVVSPRIAQRHGYVAPKNAPVERAEPSEHTARSVAGVRAKESTLPKPRDAAPTKEPAPRESASAKEDPAPKEISEVRLDLPEPPQAADPPEESGTLHKIAELDADYSLLEIAEDDIKAV